MILEPQNAPFEDDAGVVTDHAKLIPIGGGSNIIASWQTYLSQMAYSFAAIADGTRAEIPDWNSLTTYHDQRSESERPLKEVMLEQIPDLEVEDVGYWEYNLVVSAKESVLNWLKSATARRIGVEFSDPFSWPYDHDVSDERIEIYLGNSYHSPERIARLRRYALQSIRNIAARDHEVPEDKAQQVYMGLLRADLGIAERGVSQAQFTEDHHGTI